MVGLALTDWSPSNPPSFSSLRRPRAQVNKPVVSWTSQVRADPSRGLASQRKVAIAVSGPHTHTLGPIGDSDSISADPKASPVSPLPQGS